MGVAAVATLTLPTVGLMITPATAIYRASPQASHTTCSHLIGWLGKSSAGSNGQIFTPIFIRNIGSESCTLTGVPRLVYNEDVAVAVRLGLSASRANTAQRGGTVTLAPQTGTANVLLWILPTRYWSVSRCQPTRILSARVEFGRHNVGVLVRVSFNACSKMASTSIAGVAAKTTSL
jgi:hypothetical protein